MLLHTLGKVVQQHIHAANPTQACFLGQVSHERGKQGISAQCTSVKLEETKNKLKQCFDQSDFEANMKYGKIERY
jgi:hypothetical protein